VEPRLLKAGCEEDHQHLHIADTVSVSQVNCTKRAAQSGTHCRTWLRAHRTFQELLAAAGSRISTTRRCTRCCREGGEPTCNIVILMALNCTGALDHDKGMEWNGISLLSLQRLLLTSTFQALWEKSQTVIHRSNSPIFSSIQSVVINIRVPIWHRC
jgi:hypothetical protein